MVKLSSILWLLANLVPPYYKPSKATYSGLLKAGCVRHYYRLFISRSVPPRDYHYYHESLLEDDKTESRSQDPVPIKWRIVGGTQVSITEVPYLVLYGRYCGGTIIAPEWVLTAAHCTSKEKFVLAGSTSRSKATKYNICAHFIHPQWNTTRLHSHDYDYQLVLLENPIPITPQSMPIAIGNEEDIASGVNIFVSGWGHTQFKQQMMQDLVRRVRVPIMSTEECKALPMQNYKTITPRMFCAGYLYGTKDACQGDSGGPAIANGKLLGLVSFGVGCAMKDQPGVYANVPLARMWIRSVTGLPL